MNRADYMAALRRALSVLPEEERANALRYYEEYFDDAGETEKIWFGSTDKRNASR